MTKRILWDVTTKPNFPGIGAKTFTGIVANTALDAKMAVIMMEFGHAFTGLTRQMTAKRQSSATNQEQ